MAGEFAPVRKLHQDGKAYVRSFAVNGDPIIWLKRQAKHGDVLLAHLEDGVVWGRAHQDGDWVTSHDIPGYAYAPALRTEWLWEARLFGEAREILLWRDGDAWRAREIAERGEGAPAFTEWFDEPQLLWGDHGRAAVVSGVPFALLAEGAQGLRHAPPIALGLRQDVDQSLGDRRRACLRVRHYLAQEDAARIAASRLVSLEMCEEEK